MTTPASADPPAPAAATGRDAARRPRFRPHTLGIAAVALLAAVLRLASLGGDGSNLFYDAAVRSMGRSWHNFFFAAFEPAAGVSIDKPPLDLWLQVVTTKLFGFDSAALVLPQALAGTLAVVLLYDTVRRGFGRAAGLAAALALAVLPVSVATARSDTMDSLMMALDVLALWLVVLAAQRERVRFLLLAAGVMGIAFEVKLFEALIALPAIVVVYAVAVRAGRRPRLRDLGAAVAIFAVVALSWPTVVSLAPRSSRPYPLGSTNGSIWNAIFVFNGTQRVNPPTYTPTPGGTHTPSPKAARPHPPRRATHVHRHHRHARARPAVLSGTGDAPGPLRLFELGRHRYGQHLGIELAGALLFGGLALLVGLLPALRRRAARRAGDDHAPNRSAPSAEARLRRAEAAGFAVWLGTGFVLFSRTHAGLHDRYFEAFTPAVAAALGVGVVECAKLTTRRGAILAAFYGALALIALYAIEVARSDSLLIAASVACALGAAAAAAVASVRARRSTGDRRIGQVAIAAVTVLTLACVLLPAAVRSREIVAGASGSGPPAAAVPSDVRTLSSYLRSHNGSAYYEAATYSFAPAAGLVVQDGRPVLVLTSYTSPVVSVPELAAAVRAGKVRYAVIGGQCGTASPRSLPGCPDTIRWLRRRSVDVTSEAGLRAPGTLFRVTGTVQPLSASG